MKVFMGTLLCFIPPEGVGVEHLFRPDEKEGKDCYGDSRAAADMNRGIFPTLVIIPKAGGPMATPKTH